VRYLDGSNAPDVTVSLRVAVNRHNFFQQEIRSNSEGIVSFTVPALLRSDKLVWLEVSEIHFAWNWFELP